MKGDTFRYAGVLAYLYTGYFYLKKTRKNRLVALNRFLWGLLILSHRHLPRDFRPFLSIMSILNLGITLSTFQNAKLESCAQHSEQGISKIFGAKHLDQATALRNSRNVHMYEYENKVIDYYEQALEGKVRKTISRIYLPSFLDALDKETFGQCMLFLKLSDLARVSISSKKLHKLSLGCILSVARNHNFSVDSQKLNTEAFAWINENQAHLCFIALLLRSLSESQKVAYFNYVYQNGQEEGFICLKNDEATVHSSGILPHGFNTTPRNPKVAKVVVMPIPNLRPFHVNLKVQHVVCGSHHAALITTEGSLYTWGNATRGALGHGKVRDLRDRPEKVAFFEGQSVVNVACGHSHTGVVTASGDLYTFGSGQHGILGNCKCRLGSPPSHMNVWREGSRSNYDSRCDSATPRLVDMKEKVYFVQVSCANDHTAALTSEGAVYTFGSAEDGRLGHNHALDPFWNCAYSPGKVAEMENHLIVKVVCANRYTAVLTSEGKVFISRLLRVKAHQKIESNAYMQVLKFNSPLSEKRARSITCASSRIFVVAEAGDIYSAPVQFEAKVFTHAHQREKPIVVDRVYDYATASNKVKAQQVYIGESCQYAIVRNNYGSYYRMTYVQ
uniref:Uncharacterized protein n=1 Tax=Aplanochytrium stocchinoi TaxID=215587 RepID=A0A7S3LLD6_9STRA